MKIPTKIKMKTSVKMMKKTNKRSHSLTMIALKRQKVEGLRTKKTKIEVGSLSSLMMI